MDNSNYINERLMKNGLFCLKWLERDGFGTKFEYVRDGCLTNFQDIGWKTLNWAHRTIICGK